MKKFKFTWFDYFRFSSFFYSVHKKQVMHFCLEYKLGTFNQFLTEYYCEDLKWEIFKRLPESHFDYNSNSEVHASIIKFKGVGMIMKTETDYKKFTKWIEVNRLIIDNSTIGDWDKICKD